MGDLKAKPDAFQTGSKKLSATDLNLVRDAAPSLITGGDDVGTTKISDKIIIQDQRLEEPTAAKMALMVVEWEFDEFLVCDRENALVLVAKPENLRDDDDYYTLGQEVLTTRLYSTGLFGLYGESIVWVDIGGRGRDGRDGNNAIVSRRTKAGLDAMLPLDPPLLGMVTGLQRYYRLYRGAWYPMDHLGEPIE